MTRYSIEDIALSHAWLGHTPYTELLAAHPDYKPGKEYFEYNKRNRSFPRIAYAGSVQDVLEFVERYAKDRIVCYGINPRHQVFKNAKGYVRAATEREIANSQNMVVDIDIVARPITRAHLDETKKFIRGTKDYFAAIGVAMPTVAYTGRGFHLLFAFPAILTAQHQDIGQRQKRFTERFADTYKRELTGLEAKIDSTFDLTRKVKIYGTAKPGVGIVSRFYGKNRLEDAALRDYLLGLDVADSATTATFLRMGSELPQWFMSLLERDPAIRALWQGHGKEQGDVSGSGYDYSLALELLRRGYRHLDELGTILALRPAGSVARGKDAAYIQRTLAKALLR